MMKGLLLHAFEAPDTDTRHESGGERKAYGGALDREAPSSAQRRVDHDADDEPCPSLELEITPPNILKISGPGQKKSKSCLGHDNPLP